MSVTMIPDQLRSQVIALHGSHCLRCRVQCTWAGPTRLHIDHVIPEVMGGRTVLSNLQVLCRTCNLRKGASTADYRTVKSGQTTWRDRIGQVARSSDHGYGVALLTGRVENEGKYRVICLCGASDTGWAKPGWLAGMGGFVDGYVKHIRTGRRGTDAQRVEVQRLLGTVVPV